MNREYRNWNEVSGLYLRTGKEYLLKSVEEDVKHDTAKLIKELEDKAKEEADKEGKGFSCYSYPAVLRTMWQETTVSVVQLPE